MLLVLASAVFLGSESLGTWDHILLPFSSPPTTRGVTVEVFGPASTRVFHSRVRYDWYSTIVLYGGKYVRSAYHFLVFLVLASLWSPIFLGLLHLAFSLTGPRTILFPVYCELRAPSFFLIFFKLTVVILCCLYITTLRVYYCLRICPWCLLFFVNYYLLIPFLLNRSFYFMTTWWEGDSSLLIPFNIILVFPLHLSYLLILGRPSITSGAL
jgi:hypothetical protein